MYDRLRICTVSHWYLKSNPGQLRGANAINYQRFRAALYVYVVYLVYQDKGATMPYLRVRI